MDLSNSKDSSEEKVRFVDHRGLLASIKSKVFKSNKKKTAYFYSDAIFIN